MTIAPALLAAMLMSLAPGAPATPASTAADDVAQAVADAVDQLNHEEWEVRGKGEKALTELGGKAIEPLEKILEEKGDTLARKNDVVEILKDLKIAVAEKEIRKLFPEDGTAPGTYDDQLKPVIDALGERAGPYLLLVLEDVSQETTVRTLAAQGLADLGNAAAIAGLEARWKDEWEAARVRVAVALALDRLGKKEAMDSLIATAKKRLDESASNPQVAVQACNELASLHRSRKEYETVAGYYQRAKELAPGSFALEYNLACTYAVWGKKDEALTALEAAVQKGWKDVGWMKMDGDLKSLHGEERFEALVKKLGGKVGSPPKPPEKKEG